ncbi:MAG: hypothetical protein KAT05_02595, partial [Spirochaetes bacterium]|nr:hypothetical protein [Spirochaetota bacterium]
LSNVYDKIIDKNMLKIVETHDYASLLKTNMFLSMILSYTLLKRKHGYIFLYKINLKSMNI